jgi:hypothetical protein
MGLYRLLQGQLYLYLFTGSDMYACHNNSEAFTPADLVASNTIRSVGKNVPDINCVKSSIFWDITLCGMLRNKTSKKPARNMQQADKKPV